MEAGSARSVGGAFRPRTEGRDEPRRTHVLDGLFRPAHERPKEQARGRNETTECLGCVVRRLSPPSGCGHRGPPPNQQACGHRAQGRKRARCSVGGTVQTS